MSEEKEITIYDIAKALNLSAATVSRGLKDHPAISKSTKKKIFIAAEEMGYRFNAFASNLRRQKTDTIGVIVPRLNSNFMSDVLAGIEKIANEAGYNLIISQSLESAKKESENVKTMYKNRVDGLLVSLAYDTGSMEHFSPFIKKNIPLLFFDRVFDQSSTPQIVIDNYQAGYQATAHLISQGCRRIFHISGNQTKNVYLDRFKGYRQALADNGLEFNAEYLLINNLNAQAGTEAAKKLLKLPVLPDGIFIANDTCAVNCMQELKKNGLKIPDDVAVVGFNNDLISEIIEPNLTSINYAGFEMGEIAAKTLINRLECNDKAPTIEPKITLPFELIIRESSLKQKNKLK